MSGEGKKEEKTDEEAITKIEEFNQKIKAKGIIIECR